MPQHARFARTLAARMICGAALAVPMVPALAADMPDVKLNWGGYAKLAVLFSHFQDGAVAQGTGRDFYVPTQIPVVAPGGTATSHNYLDTQAKETRLFLKGDTLVEGHKVGGYAEMDFLAGVVSGNETATNAYNPALRRAYITVDNWLVGQDWSTFQNVAALPEGVDYVGPTDGTVFVRQPLVRYTYGGLQVALENPETTVAAKAGATFSNADDNSVPDLVVRYNLKLDAGDFSVAALARQLTDHGSVNGGNATTAGFGGSIAGKIPVAAHDDVRFMVSGGSGIGRYLAVNTVGDAVADASGGLVKSKLVNGYVAYHHVWDDQWRSNFAVSTLHASKNANYGGKVTRTASSASANLLYSPFTRFTLGAELRYAKRETMDDSKGSLSRLEMMAKYDF
ncbi:MAG: hypothetical protein E6R07_15060 [Nevskiaceae bacterium]|nr:MAG: hypothetical protein E6R07_15060 [Nevskiaceae bacterium]